MADSFKLIDQPQDAQSSPDTAEINQITRTHPQTGPKQIPIETIMEYRRKGLSMSDVARIVGCSKPNIVQRLNRMNAELVQVDHYKSNRADFLALKQMRMLNQITEPKLKDASAYQLAGMFGILYDKERLERGQSTSNELQIQVVKYSEDEPIDEGKGDG